MKIMLKEGLNSEAGVVEFYIVGLEKYEDIDQVARVLAPSRGLVLKEMVDGIYSRRFKYLLDDARFDVVYHEDVGVYAFSLDKNQGVTERLRDLLQRMVHELNREHGLT